MRQMGLSGQEIIEAESVIIHAAGSSITISHPQVLKMQVQGQTIYQIMGGAEVKDGGAPEHEVDQSDLEFVVSQTNTTADEAKRALLEAHGDVASAVLRLTNERQRK
ncbi:MAG: nascent polypeptide-associated complex protein [Candidatus Marsarchaeota archaeon]|nr:nascent polypeptide-associated complex protein [Candidatus Marsarchaeota archaeon]